MLPVDMQLQTVHRVDVHSANSSTSAGCYVISSNWCWISTNWGRWLQFLESLQHPHDIIYWWILTNSEQSHREVGCSTMWQTCTGVNRLAEHEYEVMHTQIDDSNAQLCTYCGFTNNT